MKHLSLTGLAVGLSVIATSALGDEGGVSFWLPGQYGSFAAVPPEPGFSMPLVSYYYSGSASGNRVLTSGNDVRLGLETDFFGQFIVPTYVPDTTILGGQTSLSFAVMPAHNSVSADLTVGSLGGAVSDSTTGFGDIFPTAQLFWNSGIHNYMAYVTGAIPVGDYDPNRLSNLGMGHAAIDFGGAYTYLNPGSGWEFSATGGVTFNFENSDTNYTNGTALHLDLAASRFVSETVHVGIVGFAYQQIAADKGQAAILGDNKSSTFGIGPQIGVFLGSPERPSYLNLRGFWEFETDNRVEGANLYLTLSIPFN